ncbi:MAG: mitochondrial fission ELM1 family protein [Myxococcota bacterium]
MGTLDSRNDTAPPAPVRGGPPPRTWLLVGEKPGDNAQSRALAEALGWPYEERRLVVRPRWQQAKPPVRPSLAHLDLDRSDPLEPPWPDLVIAIGRRLSSPALWIKARSGGRTRIVLLGKPRRLLRRFDLVVAASQYRLPERGNVVRLDLPLLGADPGAIAEASERWRPRWRDWPRPLTGVLVGGPVRRLRLDAEVAGELVAGCRALLESDGGRLVVTTSRRTPAEVVEVLARGLPEGAELHRFGDPGAENPYLGLLGLADRLVVTSDSVSMMVEVARARKPLAIFPLPERHTLWSRIWPPSRDLAVIPQVLRSRGQASWLGEPFVDPAAAPPDETEAVAERVRRLLADPGRGVAASVPGPGV